MKNTVAILCASRNSVYHKIPGCEVYDQDRDARTFTGGMPVIAHPPCRAWSAFCSHQAKPDVGEKELGMWCVEQVKLWGGILEQPAHSRLFAAARLPMPGWSHTGKSWSTEIYQAWWGYPQLKTTWLYFSKISPLKVFYPFRLHPRGSDKRTWQLMGKKERSKTTESFAMWLVDLARQTD